MGSHILRPRIVLAQSVRRRLLTKAAVDSSAAAEMERAREVPDTELAEEISIMDSPVKFRTKQEEMREATLVHPAPTNVSKGKVSVVTPVGAVLIGPKTGQSITWAARDGRRNVLTVLSFSQPDDNPVV